MIINYHASPPDEQGMRFDTLVSPSGSVATLLQIEKDLGEEDITGVDESFPGRGQSQRYVIDTIEKQIQDGKKSCVLFTVLLYNSEHSVKFAHELKEKFGNEVTIVFGGQLVPYAEYAYMKNPDIDVVCVGDAEEIMPRLLKDFNAFDVKPRYEGWVKDAEAKKFAGVSFDNFYMIRERIAEQKKEAGFSQLTVQGPGGPGCAWAHRQGSPCTFCALQNISVMSPNTVEESLDNERELQDKFNPDRLFDVANLFLPVMGQKQIVDWLHKYIKERDERGITTKKYAYLTVTSIDEEIAPLLKEAGIDEVYIGIDHFDREALKEEAKPQRTRAQLEKALDGLKENGITFRAGIVLGSAKETDETLDSVREGVRWVSKNYSEICTAIGVFPVEILPGSEVFDYARREGIGADIINKFDECGFLTRQEQKDLTRAYIIRHSDVDPERIYELENEIRAITREGGIREYTVDEPDEDFEIRKIGVMSNFSCYFDSISSIIFRLVFLFSPLCSLVNSFK